MPATDVRVRAICGDERDGYRCERPLGHTGSHRGYNEQIDAPMFWEDRIAPREPLDLVELQTEAERRLSVLRLEILTDVTMNHERAQKLLGELMVAFAIEVYKRHCDGIPL